MGLAFHAVVLMCLKAATASTDSCTVDGCDGLALLQGLTNAATRYEDSSEEQQVVEDKRTKDSKSEGASEGAAVARAAADEDDDEDGDEDGDEEGANEPQDESLVEAEASMNSTTKLPNCGSIHVAGSGHRRRRFSRRRASCDCGDPNCCEIDPAAECPVDAPLYDTGANISTAFVPCSCECTPPAGYELYRRTWERIDNSCHKQKADGNYYVMFNFARRRARHDDPCTCMCARVHGRPSVRWPGSDGDLCVGQCGGGCPGGAWRLTCMAHDICVVASKMHGNSANGGADDEYCGGVRFAREVKAFAGCR